MMYILRFALLGVSIRKWSLRRTHRSNPQCSRHSDQDVEVPRGREGRRQDGRGGINEGPELYQRSHGAL